MLEIAGASGIPIGGGGLTVGPRILGALIMGFIGGGGIPKGG